MVRLTHQREDLLKPIENEKARALASLDKDYAGIRKRLEAPKDEFETTVEFQARQKEAGELQAKMQKERTALDSQYNELANTQAKPVDDRIKALKVQKFPVNFPVELGGYDADQKSYEVRIPISEHRYYQVTLTLEPKKARELKSRKDLLTAQGDATLGEVQVPPVRLVDPVFGTVPLAGLRVKFDAGAIEKVDLGEGSILEMVCIPRGSFRMGSESGAGDERPIHDVRISHDFMISKYDVTQGQWQALMGANPSFSKGADLPVVNVSWDDCQKFIIRLNVNGKGMFRLPTEAEWEYACRAGTKERTYGTLDSIAWYDQNSGSKIHPVGQKQPNAWGLYDMNGNVWQWCQDWLGEYPGGSVTDPDGPSSGSFRIARGGSWNDVATLVRSAYRNFYTQDGRWPMVGFRLVRTAQ